MEFSNDIINITKIRDGFFLGDEATASNLDVIVQFKITHMINAAGTQIINAWESIGIKYLTLNWSENSNQNLFDQKDEIAVRIVNFIDDSSKAGEGILVHSIRGQNRASIVILIFLIKKFRWTLNKSLEFLTNKKFDVDIPKYFLNQLSLFESRLTKIGQGPRSNNFLDDPHDEESDEIIIRNTYINGLPNKQDKIDKNYKFSSKKIKWADNNNNQRKDLLCTMNLNKELIIQKEIKPVLSHKRLTPNRSILKSSDKRVNKTAEILMNNTMKQVNEKENSLYNNFTMNVLKTPEAKENLYSHNKQQEKKDVSRSYSLDNRNNEPKNTTPNVQPISNYMYQNDNEIDKIANRYISYDKTDKANTQKANIPNKTVKENSNVISPNMSISNLRNSFSPTIINMTNQYNSNNTSKLTKVPENQKNLLQNNYLLNSNSENKQFKVIDYQNYTSKNNYVFNRDIITNNKNTSNNINNKPTTFTLNNYQPELLNKKNYNNFTTQHQINPVSLSRPSSQGVKQGPIKIQNEYERKPLTPDNVPHNGSSLKLGGNSTTKNSSFLSYNNSNITPSNQYGTIKRSSSKTDPLDRPSTAPQKNDNKEEKSLQNHSSLKRLPSPNLKGNTLNTSSNKNLVKYRSPSPYSSNNISINRSGISVGSVKPGGKPKWK